MCPLILDNFFGASWFACCWFRVTVLFDFSALRDGSCVAPKDFLKSGERGYISLRSFFSTCHSWKRRTPTARIKAISSWSNTLVTKEMPLTLAISEDTATAVSSTCSSVIPWTRSCKCIYCTSHFLMCFGNASQQVLQLGMGDIALRGHADLRKVVG